MDPTLSDVSPKYLSNEMDKYSRIPTTIGMIPFAEHVSELTYRQTPQDFLI